MNKGRNERMNEYLQDFGPVSYSKAIDSIPYFYELLLSQPSYNHSPIYTLVITLTSANIVYGFHVLRTRVRRDFPNSSSSSTEQKET